MDITVTTYSKELAGQSVHVHSARCKPPQMICLTKDLVDLLVRSDTGNYLRAFEIKIEQESNEFNGTSLYNLEDLWMFAKGVEDDISHQ